MVGNTYVSLDEARAELKRRQEDTTLRAAIEEELGKHMMPGFKDTPRGAVFKTLCSPDNAFTFFNQCSRYVGASPIFFEYLADTFSRGNEEKTGLGKLRVTLEDDTSATISLFSPSRWNKCPISEIILQDGTTLVDFHHDLINRGGYPVEYRDNSVWFKDYEKPSEYYYPFFLHFVAHGVLFESYIADDEMDFYEIAVFPNLEKIQKKFGVMPLLVPPFPNPNTQTSEEDFYWWSYPPHVNAYLLEYAKQQNLTMTPMKL